MGAPSSSLLAPFWERLTPAFPALTTSGSSVERVALSLSFGDRRIPAILHVPHCDYSTRLSCQSDLLSLCSRFLAACPQDYSPMVKEACLPIFFRTVAGDFSS